MRGSPLLRSIFIVLLLVASAVVLTRLTAEKSQVTEDRPAPKASESTHRELPYRLTLSAEASEVKISTDDQPPLTSLSGNLAVPTEHAAIFLTVRWKTPAAPGEHRFAKLTLEPAGKPTLNHVFDANGDIDDVFELP